MVHRGTDVKSCEREVTLKVTSRPLRMAFIVATLDDIARAVRLSTHIWGGALSPIYPVPRDDADRGFLAEVLRACDPDVVFSMTEIQDAATIRMLNELPALKQRLLDRHVDEFIRGINPLTLLTGETVPHVHAVLRDRFSARIEKSLIRIAPDGGPLSFYVMLHGGDVAKEYRDFLRMRLGGAVVDAVNTPADLIRCASILAWRVSPLALTLTGLGVSGADMYNMESWMVLPESLVLYLDEGTGISVATAYWNHCLGHSGSPAYILPPGAFKGDTTGIIDTFLSALPSLRYITITTTTDERGASELTDLVTSEFKKRDIAVDVLVRFGRFSYASACPWATWGSPLANTVRPAFDGSARFSPAVPPAHSAGRAAYGFDAEVSYSTGRRLALPYRPAVSLLLSNSGAALDQPPKRLEGLNWSNLSTRLRATSSGVAGVTSAGDECRLYLHNDDVVITKLLSDRGYEVKANDLTRYAAGFVRRFGGIEKTLELFDARGAEIVRVLAEHQRVRACEGGAQTSRIIEYLVTRGFSRLDAAELVAAHLPALLDTGLVRRGLNLRCPNCRLQDWYGLQEHSEHVECHGCAGEFQLGLAKLDYAYLPNELASRLVRSGGHAVLMTATALAKMSPNGLVMFGGDVASSDGKGSGGELDLFWLCGDILIAAECKFRFDELATNPVDEVNKIGESLSRAVDLAHSMDAGVVVLGVMTGPAQVPDGLFSKVEEVAKSASGRAVGVHLVLNGVVHLGGTRPGRDPREVDVSKLPIQVPYSQPVKTVGTKRSNYPFYTLRSPFEEKTLTAWEMELVDDVLQSLSE
jgi:hypothetical protein